MRQQFIHTATSAGQNVDTSSYNFTSSRGKQLFKLFAITDKREKNCQVSVPVESLIPWVVGSV